MAEKFIPIKEVLASAKEGSKVSIRGWVHRKGELKEKVFVVIRDSSGILQAVFPASSKEAQKATIESSVQLSGSLSKDERAPGGFEIKGDKIEIVGLAETFPIGRDLSEEFLMDKRHLWVRSREIQNALKVRSTVFGAIHDYFRSEQFYEVQSPVFTPTACEGGSSLFKVDYFGKEAYLTQSWQLYAEALLPALEKIYCIAPSFRAEKSHTSRHLTEYWHAEMEIAWGGLDEIIKHAEGLISHIAQKVAKENRDELEFFKRDPKDLLKIKPPFPKIKYDEAVDIVHKAGMKFRWGDDIRTLEEREIVKHFGGKPVFVTHYPKEAMAFYKPRDPKNPKLALCFDLLASEAGFELIGGSERDLSVEEMKKSLKAQGEKVETYDWYFDTRRFGSVQHAGFGMGVERVIQWLCKIEHIKDTIPFPRTMNRFSP